ncbi:MAG: glucokinase, partial [SAR202 cluster bacterium]|nr:glucokinase [SAR202 cluster bacterium]
MSPPTPKGVPMYLIADVGGSKTTLALVPTLEGSWEPVTSETLASRRFTGLESLVAEYLKHKDVTITAACFGVPGPVFDNECKTTNLPWLVSANTLESQLGIPTVYLLNDLQALACAIPHLDGPDDLETLQEGRRDPRGTV